jgi:hypothetical protein
VGVDPDFYDMVDDDIIAIILDACRPLFELVGGSADANSKHSAMKHADLVMTTANLIIAAGYKMKEQARQEMAEEDLGGGIFDEDVKEMRKAAASYALPQVYDAEEQQTLDVQRAHHETPAKTLTKYKTGTKLYSLDIADTGTGMEARVTEEVRAPAKQVGLQLRRIPKNAPSHPLNSPGPCLLDGAQHQIRRVQSPRNPEHLGTRRTQERSQRRQQGCCPHAQPLQ